MKENGLYQTDGERISNTEDPVKSLAVAIISSAIVDFRKGNSENKRSAEDFIFEKNSRLFSMYCGWIGWDPGWVRNKIITKKGGWGYGRKSAVSGK